MRKPGILILAVTIVAGLVAASPAPAQETDTERQVAEGITAQIQQLAVTLQVDRMVSKLTAPDAERDKVIARVKELWDTDLMAMSDWITAHPEIGFKDLPEEVRKRYDVERSRIKKETR